MPTLGRPSAFGDSFGASAEPLGACLTPEVLRALLAHVGEVGDFRTAVEPSKQLLGPSDHLPSPSNMLLTLLGPLAAWAPEIGWSPFAKLLLFPLQIRSLRHSLSLKKVKGHM